VTAKPTPRQLALGGALAVTLAATAWVATRPEDDTASTVAAPARRAVSVAPSSAASVAAVATPGERQPWADVPAAQLAAWQPPALPPPPAPPPQPPAPPPPPMAPPLPYQMIGRLLEGEGAKAVDVAMLSGPNTLLTVKRGDVIDGQWRVEQVTPSGVSLTWLPAKLPQNIVFKPVP
jgi:hypothetical protein